MSHLNAGVSTSTNDCPGLYQFFFLFVGCLARNIYASKRETAAAISIQKYIRMCLIRRAYTALYSSAIIIQSNVRGFTIRQRFLHRKEHKSATIIQVIYHELNILWCWCDLYNVKATASSRSSF
jgi:hypothetical protein